MTTTVHILISGNKKCLVKVVNEDGSDSMNYAPRQVAPGEFMQVLIHGEQSVSVVEVGDFVSQFS